MVTVTPRAKARKGRRGRPPINQRAADMIRRLAVEHPDVPAGDIRKQAESTLKGWAKDFGRPEIARWLPGKRKVQELVSEVRKPSEEDPLDSPWSMACLGWSFIQPSDRVLIAHSAQALLDIAKRCLTIGREFTVREAIWAARLAQAIPDSLLTPLYDWASLYASRQKTAEILEQAMDSSDLDARIAFLGHEDSSEGPHGWHFWELDTVIAAEIIQDDSRILLDRTRTKHYRHLPPVGFLPETILTEDLKLSPTPLVGRAAQAWADRVHRNDRDKIASDKWLSRVATVTAVWLRRMSKSPRWEALSPNDRWDTAKRLETVICALGIAMGTSDQTAREGELADFLKAFEIDVWPGAPPRPSNDALLLKRDRLRNKIAGKEEQTYFSPHDSAEMVEKWFGPSRVEKEPDPVLSDLLSGPRDPKEIAEIAQKYIVMMGNKVKREAKP